MKFYKSTTHEKQVRTPRQSLAQKSCHWTEPCIVGSMGLVADPSNMPAECSLVPLLLVEWSQNAAANFGRRFGLQPMP